MNDKVKRETELLTQAIDGDRDALGALLELRRARLVSKVQSKLSQAMIDRIDPEEVVAEAYPVAMSKFDTFRDDDVSRFDNWLDTVVDNQLRDAIKAARRLKRGGDGRQVHVVDEGSSSDPMALWELVSDSWTPSRSVARREAAEKLRVAMAILQDDERTIITHRLEQKMDWREIADRMHSTESTVRSRYARALKKVREILGRMSNYMST